MTDAALRAAHAAATAANRADECYAHPLPTSYMLLARLRRDGWTPTRAALIAACRGAGIPLADADP